MSESSELSKYVHLLIEKTSERKIPWEEIGKEAFSADLNDVTVAIRYREFQAGPSDYRFSVDNKDGNEVEGYYQESKDPEYALLKRLHTVAKRSALKVEETLSSLEKVLKGL